MLKANELRIGNLVSNLGDIISVEYVDKLLLKGVYHRYAIYNTSVQIKHCKPIPLTEDWLNKFGFEKRVESVCDYFYIGENKLTHDWLFHLVWLKNHIDYSYEDYPFYLNGYFKIQHVHQLQNLYFALTGVELELSSNVA